MASVSVVIPCWNGRHILPRCLDALANQTYRDFEVILVDNASTDQTAPFVRANYPWVRIVSLPENRGTAGGMNAGVRQAQGEYIVLLNNDVYLSSSWLDVMVGALEQQKDFAFAACRLLAVNPEDHLDSAGDGYDLVEGAIMIGHGQPDGLEWDVPREVFCTTGAASLFRKKIFETIGNFDESYFIYLEDVDLGFRARLRGFRCLYVPQAIAHHEGSATIGRLSPFQVRLIYRNALTTYIKNMPAQLWNSVWPRWIRWWLGGLRHAPHRLPALRGVLEALLRLPATLRKRRRIQSRRTVDLVELRTVMNGYGKPLLDVIAGG